MSAPLPSHELAEVLSVATLTAVSYASTNFDNLVVLSAYSGKPACRPFYVKLTFVLVCLMVLAISLGLANAADALPAGKIRYLGLIPIALGGYQLFKLTFVRRGGQDREQDERAASPAAFSLSWFRFGSAGEQQRHDQSADADLRRFKVRVSFRVLRRRGGDGGFHEFHRPLSREPPRIENLFGKACGAGPAIPAHRHRRPRARGLALRCFPLILL